jgi:hypothetical protein
VKHLPVSPLYREVLKTGGKTSLVSVTLVSGAALNVGNRVKFHVVNQQRKSMAELSQDNPISLEDVGTRYDHLMDLKGAIELVIERIKEKNVISPVDTQKLFEFTVMARGIQTVLDSMSGLNGYIVEYQLYKMLNNIPTDPTKIEGERGTPLT